MELFHLEELRENVAGPSVRIIANISFDMIWKYAGVSLKGNFVGAITSGSSNSRLISTEIGYCVHGILSP